MRLRIGWTGSWRAWDMPDDERLLECTAAPRAKPVEAWRHIQLSEAVPRVTYGISTALGPPPGIPVLRMNNLDNGEIDLADLKYSPAPAANKLRLRAGDVLFNRTNSIDHVGRTGIWRGQLEQASFASYLVRLENDSSKLDNEYLNRWLNWPATQLRIRRYATPGVHQVNINPTNLRRTDLHLPFNLAEQHLIVTILDSLDDAIRKTEQIIEKLKQVKQGLLHDLLTRGIDENGELRDPVRNPEQFKESSLGRIPRRWQVRSLSYLLESIEAGNSPSCPDRPAVPGEWGVLKVSAIKPDGFKAEENKVLSQQQVDPNFEVKSGDLLISRANTYELVGLTCLVGQAPPHLMLSDKTLRLNVTDSADRRFVFFMTQMPFVRRQIETHATGSSGSMKNISQDVINGLTVKSAPKQEQQVVAEKVEALDRQLNIEAAELQKLQLLKQGLMDDLLTGLVRVTPLLGEEAR